MGAMDTDISRQGLPLDESQPVAISLPAPSNAKETYKYQYSPLKSRLHFRLIAFHREEKDDPRIEQLNCELAHFSLDDTAPRYRALSYEWGIPSDADRIIHINGMPHTIRKNLFDAMLEVHSEQAGKADYGTPHWIWIDALCINQEDLLERNEQVSIMSRIYSSAESVIVWLGVAKYDSDVIMDILGGTYRESQLTYRPSHEEKRNALSLWLQRPYWSRIWIVQEIQRARELRIFCGSKSISWEQLINPKTLPNVRGAGDTSGWSWFARSTRPGDEDSSVLQELKDIRKMMVRSMPLEMSYLREGNGQAQGTELRHWLSVCQDSLSTDPRDKVFALLGLATDYGIKTIRIDYSKSVTQVYRDVVDFYIPSQGKSTEHLYEYIGWVALFETLQKMLGRELELETAAMSPFEDSEQQRTLWCAAENMGTITGFPENHEAGVYSSNTGPSPRDMEVKHTMVQYNKDPNKFQLSLPDFIESQNLSDNKFFIRNTLLFSEDVETRYFEINRGGSTVNTGFAPSSVQKGDCVIGFPGSRIGLLLRDRKHITGRILMHQWNTNDEYYMRHWGDLLHSKQDTGPLFDVFPESGLTEKFYLKVTRTMLHRLTAK